MIDNAQVTEVEVIETEAVLGEIEDAERELRHAIAEGADVTDIRRKIDDLRGNQPTEVQQAAEAKTEELEALAAEALARVESDEAKIEVASPPKSEATVILCDDGLPILTPAEVRSMRDGMGISRPMLIELTGINGYRCWAAEQAHKADELDVVEWRKIVSVVLRQVDENGLPESMRPKARKVGRPSAQSIVDAANAEVEDLKSALNEAQNQLEMALLALREINEVKSLKEAKAKATAALELLTEDEDEDEAEVTTEA